MAIDFPKVERPTVKVSNIALTVTAQDLLDFIESKIGKDTIFAVEIFTEKTNWKSKGQGRVQFETLDAKYKATQFSLKNDLFFRGSYLSLSNSHDDIVVRPIEPKFRTTNVDLYVGFLDKENKMFVIETFEKVKFWVMPDRRVIEIYVDYDAKFYKLVLQFDDIFEGFGCHFDPHFEVPGILLKVYFNFSSLVFTAQLIYWLFWVKKNQSFNEGFDENFQSHFACIKHLMVDA